VPAAELAANQDFREGNQTLNHSRFSNIPCRFQPFVPQVGLLTRTPLRRGEEQHDANSEGFGGLEHAIVHAVDHGDAHIAIPPGEELFGSPLMDAHGQSPFE
jgi:hypothetical protein